jgi:hypothetical protein
MKGSDMQKKQKQSENLNEPRGSEALRVTSLEQMNALFASPIPARFEHNGRVIEVEVRALTPREESERSALLRKAQPKIIKGRTQSEDRIEYNDAKYAEEKEHWEKTARALCLYRACPIIAAAKPGLTTADEMFEYVQGLWNEHALEIIYLTIFTGGVSVAERANFTTAPSSTGN